MNRLKLSQVVVTLIFLAIIIPAVILTTPSTSAQVKPPANSWPSGVANRVWQDGIKSPTYRAYLRMWLNHRVHIRAELRRQLASQTHAIEVRKQQQAAIERNIEYNQYLAQVTAEQAASTTTTTTPYVPTTTTPSYTSYQSSSNSGYSSSQAARASCVESVESTDQNIGPGDPSFNGIAYGYFQYILPTWYAYCNCSQIPSDYPYSFQYQVFLNTPGSNWTDGC